MNRISRALWVAVSATAWTLPVASSTPRSSGFQLVGSGPASVAGAATSVGHQVIIVGGSGTPVGISASPNASVSAGGQSTQLPTDRVFVDGLEPGA